MYAFRFYNLASEIDINAKVETRRKSNNIVFVPFLIPEFLQALDLFIPLPTVSHFFV